MTAVTATLRAAVSDGLANRSSFWFQVGLMVANDITWIVFWVLFFDRVGHIRGWAVQIDANPAGGMQFNENFFVDFGAERPHQIRLEGGDSSSDSFCYPSS